MINFDDATKKDTKEHNRNWPQIPDHSHRVLVGGSGSGKTNSFINLLTHQPDIDKVYLYAKSPYEAKYIITQFYLAVPKNIRLNFRELQKLHLIIHQILTFKTLWIYIREVLQKPYSF